MSNFILVKHDAKKRGLHYDLRFEMPESKNWASFAMNSFPPLETGKRLYITRTTDHSKENALFIGIIPESEYGAGKLSKEDSGNCEVIKFTNAHIVVDFKGKKLKGIYHFVSTATFGRSKNYSKKVYAFFKGKI